MLTASYLRLVPSGTIAGLGCFVVAIHLKKLRKDFWGSHIHGHKLTHTHGNLIFVVWPSADKAAGIVVV